MRLAFAKPMVVLKTQTPGRIRSPNEVVCMCWLGMDRPIVQFKLTS